MSLGSFIARNCSTCGNYTLERNVFTKPTARPSLWTDGKRNGSNLPGLAWLLLFKCRQSSDLRDEVCEFLPWWLKFLLPGWIEVLKKINMPTLTDYIHFLMIDAREKTENGKDEKSRADPTFKDYMEFLSTGAGVFDREKDRYIRLHAWWAGNDIRREGGQASPMTKDEKTNLRVFITLLDESSDCDRLMKAEGFRELGSFAAAEKLLATHFDNSLSKAVNVIRDLSRRGVKSVEEMPTAR
jgi:hypothetical protein